MNSEPYERFKNDKLILRDFLAADRTVLANERTLLAYIRTAIAFAASGAVLIQFFDFAFVEVIGWVLILLSIGILVIGVQRYLRMRQRLARLIEKATAKDVS